MIFFPKKTKVFEKLANQASIMLKATEVFQSIIEDWKKLPEGFATLKKLENEADEIVHEITEDIEKIFILPLDKEDIKRLTESLDDIIDYLEQITNRFNIYRISQTNQGLKDFSLLIIQSAQKINEGILLIKKNKISSKEFYTLIQDLHELENKGDKLHRKILEEMLGRGSLDFAKDPISIIKWKEIFQTLEETLDKFEDFAIIFGLLRIKYL